MGEKLNPPYIENKLPAFYGSIIKVPFTLNRTVDNNQFNKMSILIKTVQTNLEKYNGETSLIDKVNGIAEFDLGNTFIPDVGQYYKIQIAFISLDGTCGYYSTVGIIKCTAQPSLSIENLSLNDLNSSKYSYKGIYNNSDIGEKVYHYWFNVYDNNNTLYETSGMLLHYNNDSDSLNQSYDEWTPLKTIYPGKEYKIEYCVQTLNLLDAKTQPYRIADDFLIAPPSWFDGELHATLYPDDGYIELSLHGTNLYGNFVLNRASSKDNFEVWNKITEFSVARAVNGLILWKDFTIECGTEYLYSIQMCNENDIKTIHIVNKEHKIRADFEDMFLSDGKRQLKIRFNPSVSSFKTTLLEQKSDTIGSKFPFFYRNGNVSYKEFPISGLLSVIADENGLFMPDNFILSNALRVSTPSELDIPQNNSNTQLTAENIEKERNFKLSVLDWLNNGAEKLFRSSGEGNYIVRLMNISMSPNGTLSGMIHTFTSTAYECMEYSFANLKKQGYLNIEDHVDYQSQHFISSLDVYNTPYQGLIINEKNNTVVAQDNLLMKNIVIKNMVPLDGVQAFTGNQTSSWYYADITGTCSINGAWNGLRFDNNISLKLGTLEFDLGDVLSSYSPWISFNRLSSVSTSQKEKKINLYTLGKWDPKYVNTKTNTFNYLAFLNDYQEGEVGEVYYLYIRKRELYPSEVQNASYAFNIENYDNNVNPIVAGSGRVYQNLGTLSKLECGNGFDIDIVYLRKIVK